MTRTHRILTTLTASLTAGAIGGTIAVADAAQTQAPPPAVDTPDQIDVPEPGDTADVPGAPDTDNIHDGTQNGPDAADAPGH